MRLGFNENDKCFDRTNGDTISFMSNMTYSCPQESSTGIVTDVSNSHGSEPYFSPRSFTSSRTLNSHVHTPYHLKMSQ